MRTVIIGAGSRGSIYAEYAREKPTEMSVVAVIEPRLEWRHRLANRHQLGLEAQFASWDDFASSPLFDVTDAAVNATPDRVHTAVAELVMDAGLPMLLEKPLAPTRDEVLELAELASRPGASPVVVGHVLRYTAFYRALRELTQSGALGRIIQVTHQENLWFNHFAHSFVRGNWGVAANSSPFILAKCCHDLDLFLWLFDDAFESVTSTGELSHFNAANRPTEAPSRCTDGCRVDCLYDARNLYLHDRDQWPANTIAAGSTTEERRAALQSGPYGRCVYACGNDVPDHQVATFDMRSGATITLAISGHHHEETRITHIDGTLGSVRARFGSDPHIEWSQHGSGQVERLEPSSGQSGHGGGDSGLMADFVQVVTNPEHRSSSTLASAVPSHVAALAAEEARVTGRRISCEH